MSLRKVEHSIACCGLFLLQTDLSKAVPCISIAISRESYIWFHNNEGQTIHVALVIGY